MVISMIAVACGTRGGHVAADASGAGPLTTITGAGSPCDQPFFARAFSSYGPRNGVAITYHGCGSGSGIQQFTANKVDFGASDVPMNAAERAAANKTGSAVVQIPIDLGAILIAYHWPSPAVPALRLDGPVLASIFLGTMTRWNDAAIQKLNPGLRLPDLAILPVHRLDSSGTTYITTDYLSTVSAAWKDRVGKGKSVVWPRNSLGAVGNGGVAAAVAAHVGAIGYMQLNYGLSTHLSYARLKDKAGTFVFPTQVTVWDAALQFPQVSPTHFAIVDAPGSVSYPMAGYSWVLLRQHPRRHARELVKLFRWMVTDGQTYAAQLNSIALPPNAQSEALHALDTIT